MSNHINQTQWQGVGKLQELVTELERQQDSRVDACIHTNQLQVTGHGNSVALEPVSGTPATEFFGEDYSMLKTSALTQLGQKMPVPVPVKFIKQMQEFDSATLCDLLNSLLNKANKRLFIRQLDGRVRAVLSDSYKVIDNYDLLFTALEVSKQVGARVMSCQMSDHKMKIKLVAPQIWEYMNAGGGMTNSFGAGELGNKEWQESTGFNANSDMMQQIEDTGGNIVYPQITLTSSETGHGASQVDIGTFEGACCNSMTFDRTVRAIHLGSKLDEGIFSHETQQQDGKTMLMKLRDAIRAGFDREMFKTLCEQRKTAQGIVIEQPIEAVDNVIKNCDLSEDNRDQLLTYFIGDYKPTVDGIAGAVSRMAQDCADDVEMSSKFETIAGRIIERPQLALK